MLIYANIANYYYLLSVNCIHNFWQHTYSVIKRDIPDVWNLTSKSIHGGHYQLWFFIIMYNIMSLNKTDYRQKNEHESWNTQKFKHINTHALFIINIVGKGANSTHSVLNIIQYYQTLLNTLFYKQCYEPSWINKL